MSAVRGLARRVTGRWRRTSIQRLGCRRHALGAGGPYISFTFDDFPRSALLEGGRILEAHEARGTYFVSCGLLDSMSPSGPIASASDLSRALKAGHELGCHTFEHLDGTVDTPADFERSIAANRAAISVRGVAVDLTVFAYPLEGPDLAVKRVVGRHFAGCRWGGQTFNQASLDLNLLQSYFIDWRSRDDLDGVTRLIRANTNARGWLIFSTHDIASDPSPYGCTPEYFEAVVQLAVESGARILPMGRVCEDIGARKPATSPVHKGAALAVVS